VYGSCCMGSVFLRPLHCAVLLVVAAVGCGGSDSEGSADETGTSTATGAGTGTSGADDGGSETGVADDTGTTGDGPDLSEALFDPEHIVEVDIELPETDWDTLRHQTRGFDVLVGDDCQVEPFASPFSYFPASVTVDGITMDEIGVRKKGFLGSMDDDKPSLKLDFQEYVPDVTAHGVKRMTLNNAKQDAASIRQCLVYQLFGSAGIASSRCNFAHVTVNGADLGIYVNVEPVKKAFLRRNFDSDEGNLFEGTLSDFRDGWLGTFEQKTNKMTPDETELLGLTSALESSDDEVLAALSEHVDIDQFIEFWAMEVLVQHWDGYSGNTNNFFVYRDPADDRFEFIPWGVDGVLGAGGGGGNATAVATGLIASRLYAIESTNTQYRERLQYLLDEVWIEAEIQGEINRMEALITPIATAAFSPDLGPAISAVRNFVDGRRGQIESELAGPPGSPAPLRDTFCFLPNANVEAQFSTTWNTLDQNPLMTGSATITADAAGQPITTVQDGALSGIEPDDGEAQIGVYGQLGTGEIVAAIINMPVEDLGPGTFDVGFAATGGAVLVIQPGGGYEVLGFALGELTLDEASTTDGAAISGSFSIQSIEF